MKNKMKKIIAAAVAVLTLAVGSISLAGCSYCAHTFKTIDGDASTCSVHGHKTSYECTKCGKLFAYSGKQGLYEIDKAEERPLADHTPELPDLANDATDEEVATATKNLFKFKLKEGVTAASSPDDYEIYAKCADCGEEGLVPEENLFHALVPDGMNKGKHVMKDGVNIATKFNLEAGWGGVETADDGSIAYNADGGLTLAWDSSDNFSSWYVPVNMGVRRYMVVYAYNSSSTPIDIVYRAIWMKDKSSKRIWSDTEATLAPNGYTAFTVSLLNSKAAYPAFETDIFAKEALTENTELIFSTYYYVDGAKPNEISVYSKPQTTYQVGDNFSAEGLKLRVGYGDNIYQVIDGTNLKTSLDGKILTAEDTKVTIKYKGLSTTLAINVGKEVEKKKVTLVGATFSDGTKSKELEVGSSFLTDVKLDETKTFVRFVGMHGETLSAHTPVSEYAMVVKAEYAEDAEGKIITIDDCNAFAYGLLDGVYMTKCGALGTHDVQFEFKEALTLDKVLIYPWVGSTKSQPFRTYSCIKSFTVSVSNDGENWTDIYECEYDPACEDETVYDLNDDGAGGTIVLINAFFEPVTAKFIRIQDKCRNIYSTGSNSGMSEVEIFYQG